MDDMRTMYHYTTEEGAIGIHKSRVIKAFPGAHGNGVYLTKLEPSLGRKKLAENNYGDDAWANREDAGNVNRAIELRIPRNKLHHQKVKGSSRDIYIYGWNEGGKGKNMMLNAYLVAIHTLDLKDRLKEVEKKGASAFKPKPKAKRK